MPVAVIIIPGCKKIYDPDIDFVESVLVVQGMVTQGAGPHTVLLSLTTPFDYDAEPAPLENAMVYVKNSSGVQFLFAETDPGRYNSLPELTGQVGETYTLHIETPQGDIYESSPQVLPAPVFADSVYGESATKEFIEVNPQGYNYTRSVMGMNLYLDMDGAPLTVPGFRTGIILLILYTEEVVDTLPPMRPPFDFFTYVRYSWLKWKLTDMPNLNLPDYRTMTDRVNRHFLCFASGYKPDYRLLPNEIIHKQVLLVDYYSLNQDAYDYYSREVRQLTSEDRFFDPVAVQLQGNMTCLNKPGKSVLGLFEASHARLGSYLLLSLFHDIEKRFVEIDDLHYIPDKGSSVDIKPPFWID